MLMYRDYRIPKTEEELLMNTKPINGERFVSIQDVYGATLTLPLSITRFNNHKVSLEKFIEEIKRAIDTFVDGGKS